MWLSKLSVYYRLYWLQRTGWVLIAGILFYCYEFFLRILTGAYQNEITSYFHINSHLGFSFLISSYNLTYLIMQIPAGILLDRFGSRRCLMVATIICGFGSALFIAGGYYIALISVLLLGWIICSPLVVYLVTKLKWLNQVVSIFLVMLLINILMIGFLPNLAIHHLTLLIFTFGLFSSVQVIVWQCFNQICDISISGIGIAVTNMIITAVTEVGQLFSGVVLDIEENYYHNLLNYDVQILMLLFVLFIIGGWCVFYIFTRNAIHSLVSL